MFALEIFIIFILSILCFAHFSQKPRRQALANIPGPYCIPGIGCVQKFFCFNSKSVFELSFKFTEQYGKIFKGWAFNRVMVFIADAELNEQLLSSAQHIVKHSHYMILKPWLGIGLLISHGSKWFTRRKIITPTFHFNILEQFVQIFDQQASILIQKLQAKANGSEVIDISSFICLATLDIIAETAMGTKINAQSDEHNEYTSAIHELSAILSLQFLRFHLHNSIAFALFKPFLKLRQTKLIKTLHSFTTKVIEERRMVLQSEALKTQHNSTENQEIGLKKRAALLDVLLQASIEGKPLSNDDIREEVDTFMFEGHDTTTSAMSFCLHAIARNARVQQKIYEELQTVLNANKPQLTLHDLNNLKYLECVIKESLRLYPPVPFIARHIVENFNYTHSKLGKGVIPAGTEIIIPVYSIMRDEQIFEKPNEFMPERFENFNANSNAFVNIPFSAGPRNCIGQKFAMYEMKTILARILQNFELLPLGKNVELVLNIVMRSDNGYQLALKPRI